MLFPLNTHVIIIINHSIDVFWPTTRSHTLLGVKIKITKIRPIVQIILELINDFTETIKRKSIKFKIETLVLWINSILIYPLNSRLLFLFITCKYVVTYAIVKRQNYYDEHIKFLAVVIVKKSDKNLVYRVDSIISLMLNDYRLKYNLSQWLEITTAF